jgi:anthranilate phosphoribosyltransferase
MLDVIEGRHEDGPVLELLALNAAALLEQMGHADSLASGVTLAREAVASGKAAELLRHTRALQNLPPA